MSVSRMDGLPNADAMHIDAVADEFELAFRRGLHPRIEDFLARMNVTSQNAGFRALLRIELELRRDNCEEVVIEEYLNRFSHLRDAVYELWPTNNDANATAEYRIDQIGPADHATRLHSASQGRGSGRLEVRCPNCHSATEVAVDTSLTDLTCASCGSHFSLVDQSKATHMAPSLSKLGRFDLVERIGVGGFGSVWKARDKELDRTVAIKVPRASAMTNEEQEKFFREARAAAQLRHPNIVSVHEVGRDGDSVYIVSDFVRGVTLGDWLTGQQLTGREAAELCTTIADALEHAHGQGVVHRDLKPANIMMDGNGQPHLMDFGLARREVGEVTVTMEGQILGTPAYMSPEQAQGEAHSADRRSDIYSLGVVLFQLLTGELPFRGNARMIMHQVIHDEPPSPRKLNANINRDLETIALKCLEKDPNRRYQTARELAAELRRVLMGEPIHARPIGAIERTWRWSQRYPLVAALSSAVVLSLLTGVLLSSISYLRAEKARQSEHAARLQADEDRRRALDAETEAQSQKNIAEAALFESQRAAYLANLRLADQELRRKEYESARAFLARCPEPMRRWEWRHLNTMLDQSLATSREHKAFATSVAIALDGRRIYSGSLEKTVRIWEPETGRQSEIFAEFKYVIRRVTTSADGRRLAIVHSGSPVEIWDLEGKNRIGTVEGHGPNTLSAEFSPDGRLLATGGGKSDATVRVWEWQQGRQTAECKGHQDKVWSVAFSPDGKQIASGSYDQSVRLWNAKTGKEIRKFGPLGDLVNSVAFSPDGKSLAAGNNLGTIFVWDLETGTERYSIRRHESDINSVAYSSDGKSICSGSKDGTIAVSDASTGQLLTRLRGHESSVIDVKFTPDGKKLVSCGRAGEVKYWDASALSIWMPPTKARGRIGTINLSKTNPEFMLAIGGSIERWSLATVERIEVLGDSSNSFTLAVAGDEATIAYVVDEKVVIAGAATGHVLQEIPTAIKFTSLAFSSDNKQLYAVGVGEKLGDTTEFPLYAYNVRDGSLAWKSPNHVHKVTSIAVQPQGDEVWTAGYGRYISVWNSLDGQLKQQLAPSNSVVRSVVFNSDGNVAASSESDGTIVLWDAKTKSQLRKFRGHPGELNDMAFHPHEPRLATAGADYTIRIWDTSDGTELLKVDNRKFPTTLRFSPDGAMLLIGDVYGQLTFWYAGMPPHGFPPLEKRQVINSSSNDIADNPRALNEAAWRLATSPDADRRDGKRAVELARRACEWTYYRDAGYIDTLAAAYAEIGNFDAAVRCSEEAIALLGEKGDEKLRAQFEQALSSYRANKPLRIRDEAATMNTPPGEPAEVKVEGIGEKSSAADEANARDAEPSQK